MRVLVLNPGSSSLKSSVVDTERAALPPLARTTVDWGVDATLVDDPAADLRTLFARLTAHGVPAASIEAIGCRVVHGGTRFRDPVIVDESVVADVAALRSLAPLHNEIAAVTMRAALAAAPAIPQVAVFDTAFHATLDPAAYRYPVPEPWYAEWGVRRYGFHGLSVAWAVERAAALLERPAGDLRLVVAHLGSGCSVTAVDGGRSVDTSMGLTPLEGLMMGSRAGSIDPGILVRILRQGLRTVNDLADDLDHRSGLLGVSGRTSDVRVLLVAAADGDERAALALSMFERRTAAWIASVATSLPRLDGIVFTGGIGEHAAPVRAGIVGRLATLGLAPIEPAAVAEDAILSAADARVAVLRVEAREDVVIARETERLVRRTPPPA